MKYLYCLLPALLSPAVSGYIIDQDYLVKLFTHYFSGLRGQVAPSSSLHDHVSNSEYGQCEVAKPGSKYGEATMFQEEWVHGKTGACGFEGPWTEAGELCLCTYLP